MILKFKKLSDKAMIPFYGSEGSAGLDLTAISVVDDGNNLIYNTGIAVKIPDGYVGLLFPRSSVYKQNLVMANSVGVIDSDYTGEIKIIFKKLPDILNIFKSFIPGDRIAQLVIVPYPKLILEEVSELPKTERGANGFGSTGV